MNESNQPADDPEPTGKSAHLTTQRLEKLPLDELLERRYRRLRGYGAYATA